MRDPHAADISWMQRFWLACERDDRDALHVLAGQWGPLAAGYPHVPAWAAGLALLHARLGDRRAASGIPLPVDVSLGRDLRKRVSGGDRA